MCGCLHGCDHIWSPPPTIVHLGDFFSSYGPSAIVYLPCVHPTTPLFSPTSSNFRVFRMHAHLLWSLPPTRGCHRPPQSTGHPSHPPAGLVPLSSPLPIDFYQSHTQSVLSGSGKPPIGPLPPVCAPCTPPSICPSIHLSTCPVQFCPGSMPSTTPSRFRPFLSGLHALLCPSVPSSVHCHHWVTSTSVKRHCIYSKKKSFFFPDTSATYLPGLRGLGPKGGIGISYGYPPHTLYYTLGHPLPANGTINPAPHHASL